MSSESSQPLAHELPGGHASSRSPTPETELIPEPDHLGGEGDGASTVELSELLDLIRAAWQSRTMQGERADANRETETGPGHTPHPLLRPGTRLEGGMLCILEPIDAGGMGDVFLAWHEALNAEVVVKVARDPAMEARFRHEIELQNRLGSHPHIVAVKTAGRFSDCSYLMMEYVPGLDLKRYIREHGPLPWREAWACIRQAALGLAHAHAQGVVHRDLKPSNLIRQEADGSIKILDWGLARRSDGTSPDENQRLTQPGTILGTPDYIAPEQIDDPEQVGPASDLYSLGCTLYELLTGRPPFHQHGNKLQAHLNAPIPTLPAELGVPPGVDRVLRRLLAKRADRRYGSAQELVEALHGVLVGAESNTPQHGSRNWRRLTLAAASIAAVAALAVMIVPDGRRGKPTGPAVSPLPVRIERMEVTHSRGDGTTILGTIGVDDTSVCLFNDEVRIRASLSAPAYCYLIALHPDGSTQLYYPEGEAGVTTPPPLSDRVSYPLGNNLSPLTDGMGLQAFVLVASRRQLPAYKEWEARLGNLPWGVTKAEGIWHYDGLQYERRSPKRRSDPRPSAAAVPAPFASACRALARGPGIDAIEAWAFPVLPEDSAPTDHAPVQDRGGP
jgi:serine/threonine-protein kinase